MANARSHTDFSTDRDNRLADGVRQLDLFFPFDGEEEDSFRSCGKTAGIACSAEGGACARMATAWPCWPWCPPGAPATEHNRPPRSRIRTEG